MKLKTKNLKGFAACLSACGTDECRECLTGVLIKTSGEAVATDGTCLISCKDAFEPFEGDDVLLKFGKLTSSHINSNFPIEVNILEGYESYATFFCGRTYSKSKSLRKIVAVDVLDKENFPDTKKFLKEYKTNRLPNGIFFQTKYIDKAAKIINGNHISSCSFMFNGELEPVQTKIKCHDGYEDVFVVTMPMRQ
ncbi:MAG: hypothetical protein COA63_000970 [Methylophaga sp.]|nr:hypothetical protein [Methylophaga sp.]